MLNEEEKQWIIQEIRSQLEQQKKVSSYKQNLWLFLNSTFGLWFLSTITVGFITWSYTQWQLSQSKFSEKIERIRKIDTEIAHRLDYFYSDLKNTRTISDYYRAVSYLGKTAPLVVYLEFEQRSLSSLLLELSYLVPKDKMNDLKSMVKMVNRLASLGDHNSNNKENQSDPLTPELQRAKDFAFIIFVDTVSTSGNRWQVDLTLP